MSSYTFCKCIEAVVEEIERRLLLEHVDIAPVVYIDDNAILTKNNAFQRIKTIAQEEFQKIGLEIQPDKCKSLFDGPNESIRFLGVEFKRGGHTVTTLADKLKGTVIEYKNFLLTLKKVGASKQLLLQFILQILIAKTNFAPFLEVGPHEADYIFIDHLIAEIIKEVIELNVEPEEILDFLILPKSSGGIEKLMAGYWFKAMQLPMTDVISVSHGFEEFHKIRKTGMINLASEKKMRNWAHLCIQSY